MDIANLVIAVDSTSADEAAGKLDRLSQAGARAQTATGGMTRASAAGAQATRQFTAEQARAVLAIEQFALGAGRLQTATRGATLSTTLMGAATGALGFALASAASAAVPFITNIIESGSAARQAAEEQRYMAAASADLTRVGGELGEAQAMLGRMFDLATGRLSVQNEVVREAIRLQAILAQIDANRRGLEAGGRLAAMRPDSFFDTRGRPVSRAAGARGGALLDDSGDMTGRAGLTPNPGVSAFNRLVNSFGSNRNASVAQFRAELEALQRGGQLGGVDINRAVIEAIQIAQNRNMIRTMQGVQAVVEGRAPLPPSMRTGSIGRTGTGARGGGGRGAGGDGADGRPREDRTAERRFQISLEVMRAQEGFLVAQNDLNTSAHAQAVAARRRVIFDAQIERLQIGERERKGELTAAEAEQLRLANQRTRNQRLSNISAQEADNVARERLTLSQADLRTAEEIARLQGQLAETAGERRDSQLRLLDLSQRQERAELDAILASQTATEAERERARRRAAQLDGAGALQRALIDRDTEGPMAAYMRELRTTTRDISTLVEGVQVRAFNSLEDALLGVITGTQSLGDAFADFSRSILRDVAQMIIRMLILRAVMSLFGGAGFAKGAAFSGGGALPFAKGGILPFAAGGIVSAPTFFPMRGGRTGLMGEAGPEAIMPLARDGRGRLGVRAGGSNGAPQQVEIMIGFGPAPDFAPYVHEVSGAYAGEAVKVSVGHMNKTMSQIARPKLMGR